MSMLLLEWNIFPESYQFYFVLIFRVLSFPQGQAVAVGVSLFIAFVALPRPRLPGKGFAAALFLTYGGLLGAKAWPFTKPYLIWLRQPAPRAMQVAWTDLPRFWKGSVLPANYNARSPGYMQLSDWIGSPKRPKKILIILLESWGESPSDLITIVKEIQRTASPNVMRYGFTSFAGPTLAGEVRDLCGSVLSFRSVDASLRDCLPRRAQRVRYATVAFHGYEGYFYNRQILYPQIGFMHSTFALDFGRADRCGGAFNGICDDVVLERAVGQLRAPGAQFVYMMSLSAHEPVGTGMLNRSYLRSHPSRLLDGRQINEALIRLAVSQVRQMSLSANADIALYIAGDHNPPGKEEALGLPSGKVPYLLLRWMGQRPS